MELIKRRSIEFATEYQTLLKRADAFRSEGLLQTASLAFLQAAQLAPDQATETALLSRAFECRERAGLGLR